jgi:sec-independent protein translocase protein TatB
MFDIGWSELLVIGVVALIAIGPKELPGVLRMVGQWMGKVRRMASDFQGQFHEAMREAEMADIKKSVDDLASTASSVTNFDPLGDISKQFETAIEDKPASGTAPDPAPTVAQSGTPAEPATPTVSPDAPPVPQDNATAQPVPGAPAEPEVAPQPKVGTGV